MWCELVSFWICGSTWQQPVFQAQFTPSNKRRAKICKYTALQSCTQIPYVYCTNIGRSCFIAHWASFLPTASGYILDSSVLDCTTISSHPLGTIPIAQWEVAVQSTSSMPFQFRSASVSYYRNPQWLSNLCILAVQCCSKYLVCYGTSIF